MPNYDSLHVPTGNRLLAKSALTQKATYLHIQWQCPLIQLLWLQVFQVNRDMTLLILEGSPKLALFFLVPGPLRNIKKVILRHFLVVTCTIIARHWKLSSTPSLVIWVHAMNDLMNI